MESEPAKITKALFVSLRPLYGTHVLYSEKYSRAEVQAENGTGVWSLVER